MAWRRSACADGKLGGADPLVRSRRPRRLARSHQLTFVGEERVQGDPRGPGGPPHFHMTKILALGKLNGIGHSACRACGSRIEILLDIFVGGGIKRRMSADAARRVRNATEFSVRAIRY